MCILLILYAVENIFKLKIQIWIFSVLQNHFCCLLISSVSFCFPFYLTESHCTSKLEKSLIECRFSVNSIFVEEKIGSCQYMQKKKQTYCSESTETKNYIEKEKTK